jgi:hypothetical protein
MTRRLFVRRDSIVDYSWVRLVDVLREVVGFAQLWFFIAALGWHLALQDWIADVAT